MNKCTPISRIISSLQHRQSFCLPYLNLFHNPKHLYTLNYLKFYNQHKLSYKYESFSTLSCLSSFPHPQNLDCQTLLKCTSIASKTAESNEEFWNLILQRSKKIYLHLKPREMISLLHSLQKARVYDEDLFLKIALTLSTQLHLTSVAYISKLLSTLAKYNFYHQALISSAVHELQHRYVDITSSIEFAMLISALSRLQVYNIALLRKLSSHFLNLSQLKPFHIRELSVISNAFASFNYHDPSVFSHISDLIPNYLLEATVLEISLLLRSFIRLGHSTYTWRSIALSHSLESLRFMGPQELCNAAYAFGSIKEVLTDTSHLDHFYTKLAERFSVIISMSSTLQIVSLLQTFGRWLIPIETKTLLIYISRLHWIFENSNQAFSPLTSSINSKFSTNISLDLEPSGQTYLTIIYSLSSILSCMDFDKSLSTSTNLPIVEYSFDLFSLIVKNIYSYKPSSVNINLLIRTLESLALLRVAHNSLLDQFLPLLAINHHKIDKYSATTLYNIYHELGSNIESDFMIGLRQKIGQ